MYRILVNKLLIYVCVIILSVLLVFYIYGGVKITSLGLYSDDWERIHLFGLNESNTFTEKVNIYDSRFPGLSYRITLLLLLPLSAQVGDLINNPILGIHLFSFALNVITLLFLFVLLKKFTKSLLLAFIVSCFILTIPGRSTNFFWPSTQIEMLAILLYLLVLNIHFTKINVYFSGLIIFLFTLFSVWSYELTAFIPLIFFAFTLFDLNKRNLVHFISSAFAVASIMFFKFYAYSHLLGFESVKKVSTNVINLASITNNFTNLTNQLIFRFNYQSLISVWLNNPALHYIAITVVSLGIYIVFHLIRNSGFTAKKDPTFLVIGIVTMFGALIPLIPSYNASSSLGLFGKEGRFTSVPALGFGFIVFWIFLQFNLKLRGTFLYLAALFFGSFTILNLLGLNQERLAYIKSWEIQKDTLSRIDYSLVSNKENALIFVTDSQKTTDFNVPVFQDQWTISYALSVFSKNRNLEAEFATNPYGKLDKNNGYKTKFWERKYYTTSDIYLVDLTDKNPIILPLYE